MVHMIWLMLVLVMSTTESMVHSCVHLAGSSFIPRKNFKVSKTRIGLKRPRVERYIFGRHQITINKSSARDKERYSKRVT